MAAAATRAAAGAFAQALALRVSRAQLLPPGGGAALRGSGRSLLLLPDDGALAAAAAARRRAAIAPHLARVVHDVHRGGGAAPTAHLEYFGTLKTICKAEERRKLRKKQRRFVQYLVKFGPRRRRDRRLRVSGGGPGGEGSARASRTVQQRRAWLCTIKGAFARRETPPFISTSTPQTARAYDRI